MIIHKYPAVMALALCAFVVPALGGPQGATAHGAGTFPSFITFDANPEGVAVDKVGNVYASVTTATGSDQIWKFSPSGEKSVLVDLGAPGYAAGLAVDAVGNVYMARVVVPGHGVYRVSPDGDAALLPGTEQIVGADALAFDQRGTLYVTEIFSGDLSTQQFAQGGI